MIIGVQSLGYRVLPHNAELFFFCFLVVGVQVWVRVLGFRFFLSH